MRFKMIIFGRRYPPNLKSLSFAYCTVNTSGISTTSDFDKLQPTLGYPIYGDLGYLSNVGGVLHVRYGNGVVTV